MRKHVMYVLSKQLTYITLHYKSTVGKQFPLPNGDVNISQ